MKIKFLLLASICVASLAGCGGGGGNGPATVVGLNNLSLEAAGLETGKSLLLNVQSETTLVNYPWTVTSSNVLVTSKTASIVPNGRYTVTVTKQPLNQLCTVINGTSIPVLQDGNLVSIVINCHSTYFNDTGVFTSDAAGDDATFGRDKLKDQLTKTGSGVQGFDFTKICSNGASCSSALWECVKDNVTGLTWTRAVYPWSNPAVSPNKCGYTDWRVPTVHELMSILYGSDASGVDLNFFDAATKLAISSDISVDSAPNNYPWGVVFKTSNLVTAPPGSAGTATDAAGHGEFRWVRGGISDAMLARPANYSASNGVIVDGNLDVMWWFPAAVQLKNWSNALQSLTTLNTVTKPGGYNDWRLPNRSELDSVIDRSRSNPALGTSFLNAARTLDATLAQIPNVSVWTSTPAPGTSQAWTVDFRTGDITFNLKTDTYGVVYVRDKTRN
jgi:hypothetical protein